MEVTAAAIVGGKCQCNQYDIMESDDLEALVYGCEGLYFESHS